VPSVARRPINCNRIRPPKRPSRGSSGVSRRAFLKGSGAAAAATAELARLGHRRIGFITGSLEYALSADRREGYQRAVRAAGIDDDPHLIAQGDFTFESGEHMAMLERWGAFDVFPQSVAQMDAIVAGSA